MSFNFIHFIAFLLCARTQAHQASTAMAHISFFTLSRFVHVRADRLPIYKRTNLCAPSVSRTEYGVERETLFFESINANMFQVYDKQIFEIHKQSRCIRMHMTQSCAWRRWISASSTFVGMAVCAHTHTHIRRCRLLRMQSKHRFSPWLVCIVRTI